MSVILNLVRDHVNSFQPYGPRLNYYMVRMNSLYESVYSRVIMFYSYDVRLDKKYDNSNSSTKGKNEEPPENCAISNVKYSQKISEKSTKNRKDKIQNNGHSFKTNVNTSNNSNIDVTRDTAAEQDSDRIASFSYASTRLKDTQLVLLKAYARTRSDFVWRQKEIVQVVLITCVSYLRDRVARSSRVTI